jgi:hypothetical protein
MIGYFLKLLNWPNVSSDNSFFLLVNSDGPKDLRVLELFVLKVSKSSGKLALILLVENDFAGSSVIIDLKHNSHWLVNLWDDSANHNDLFLRVITIFFPYLSDLLSVNLKRVLWCDWGLIEHFECNRGENLIFALLLLLLTATLIATAEVVVIVVSSSVVIIGGCKESWIVICEL